jgi:catechol 2,3-dioxygenase-like lactoylglutathione lyase family enzyme
LANLFNIPVIKSRYFWDVPLANEVTLHFMTISDQKIAEQHYAFHIEDEDFDRIRDQLSTDGQTYWADPGQQMPQQINTEAGGRGLYFLTGDGHWFEVFTKPPTP